MGSEVGGLYGPVLVAYSLLPSERERAEDRYDLRPDSVLCWRGNRSS